MHSEAYRGVSRKPHTISLPTILVEYMRTTQTVTQDMIYNGVPRISSEAERSAVTAFGVAANKALTGNIEDDIINATQRFGHPH